MGQGKGVVSKLGFPLSSSWGLGSELPLVCQRAAPTFSPGSRGSPHPPHPQRFLCWRSDKRGEGLRCGVGCQMQAQRLGTSEDPVTHTSPAELTRQPLTPPPGTFSCSEPQSKTKGRGEEGATMPSNHRGRRSPRPPAARRRVLPLAEAQGLTGQLPGPLSPRGCR